MKKDDIAIIYQDHHTLIVNKPAGVVIHPTYKHTDGDTMWDAVLAYLERQGRDDWQPPSLPDEPAWAKAPLLVQEMLRAKRTQRLWQEWGLLPRPCLLHRLDKDTSGVVALARTERSRHHLARQFNEHSAVKRYLAVVTKGAPEWARPRVPLIVKRQPPSGYEEVVHACPALCLLGNDRLILDGPLRRDPDERRRCIVAAGGQEAKTMIRVLAAQHGYILLDVQPVTGRIHQIRAHLAAFGYGIVGDQVYAPLAEEQTLQRQFLHAYSLGLHRFPDDHLCTFVAPLASDLLLWLKHYFPEARAIEQGVPLELPAY
ncbi:MAG: RluA family pseudouridine synthase [Chloroflexi bacterium]|nr:RluA family pseudouridine synthase [Ktedonobacteraceae bacterium]MBV9708698.1 RluA family pseudouridine synthase [Chloroflexota bacterium]